jgi:hypothetical protein
MYCNSAVHGHEKVPLSCSPCNVKYYVMLPQSENVPWAIIIGYGIHTHMRPTLLPSRVLTRSIIQQADGDRVSTRDVLARIEDETGLIAPVSNVSRLLRTKRQATDPHGTSIAALQILAAAENDKYVHEVCGYIDPADPEDIDSMCISIIFAEPDLLAASARTGRFGVVGTHGVVDARTVEHGLHLEMSTIVFIDPGPSGRVVAAVRQL